MLARRFPDSMTFASLLAPVPEEEFRSQYWEQKPLIVHRGDTEYYGDLFTLQDFDEAITRAPDYIKTVDAANAKVTQKRSATGSDLDAVLADARDGATLILEQLQRREPKLGLLCRLLGQELGHAFETNLFLTPAHGKGSIPHWDNADTFVLQLMGYKNWRIENKRRVFPVRPYRMGNDVREFQGATTSYTIHQGDLIYIPRGYMHVAECGSEPSLHIALSLVPVVLEEFLRAAIRVAVQRNEDLRVALPLGFMQDNAASIIKCAAKALGETADEGFLADVFDQFKDELTTLCPLDVSGQIADIYRPAPLVLEDNVGSRRGIVWRMRESDNTVAVTFGRRRIVFPDIFREALEFALNTLAFAVRDVPGALRDEEKIAFVERLMQEGLVVRKERA